MPIIRLSLIVALTVSAVCITSSANSQMRYSSLVSIPDTDREFSSRLNELASKSGDAADFFRLKLAESELKHGDEKAAMKLAERADNKAFKFWRDVILAEVHLAEDQPKKTLSQLAKLPPRPHPDLSFGETFYANLYKRALLTLRDAKTALGENTDEESAELAANFPIDPDVAGYSASLSAEQKTVKLHNLVFAYKYALVPDVITPGEIISSRMPHEKKCEALYDLGYGLRMNTSMASTAIDAFEGIVGEKCDRNLEARALYWIGSLGSSAQRDEEAERALKKLTQEFKGHRYQDDGWYLLYKRAERRGDIELAQKYYDELMKLPKGDMRDKLAFDTAFPKYTRKDYESAALILEPLVDSDAADERFTQVLYWYARSLEKSGGDKNMEKAKKAYERLAADYPYSFYATLASQRAGIPLSIPPLPVLGGQAPSKDDGFFKLIEEMNHDGLHSAAKQVMDLAMNLNPEWERSNEEFIARTYMESQNYRKALDMAAKHFDTSPYGPVQPQTDPMFAAFFPDAFSDAVKGGYRLTNLPRGSIEGIMREESLFQQNVRSHAGAVGLMQLMPRTAAMLARGSTGGADPSNLTNPSDNILLGSSYLESMLRKFSRMEYAIMAYNAGPGNVNRFIRSLGHLDLDEFIENIPINETRGYVKRVMRSQRVYASLNEGTGFKNNRPRKFGKRH